jgi:hypothetical protein
MTESILKWFAIIEEKVNGDYLARFYTSHYNTPVFQMVREKGKRGRRCQPN